jgi:hypothetical protein
MSKTQTVRPPPKVHEWSQRRNVSVNADDVRQKAIVPSEYVHKMHFTSRDDLRVIQGGTPEALKLYGRLFWEKNDSKFSHFNFEKYKFDIIIVTRKAKAQTFFADDPEYISVTQTYPLITGSCVVCTERGSIMNVFVTGDDLPSLNALSTQARVALECAKTDLKPRHSFAVGGDYSHRDPEYATKMRNMQVRMNGTIWNDGLQTYTSATPGWGGKYFTQYFRRRPGTDLTTFSLPFVGMFRVEEDVVPAIADARRTLQSEKRIPSAFPGIPCNWMPATQVGISENFSVKTHGDSCISSVTETIFWANRNIPNARFAVTSLEIAFDIGSRPCILFQKGNEMHGTVPGTEGSCGLVLISKRNTLQQFEHGAYTDRTVVS